MPSLAIFGDSIAHGGGDPQGGWPVRIRLKLVAAGLGDHAYPRGLPGDTSATLLDRFADELQHLPCETAVICIGTNDCQVLRDDAHPRSTDQEYAANLVELIRLAKRRCKWVVLVDPPDLLDSPCGDQVRFFRRQRLDTLRPVLARVAREQGCWHIPLAGVPRPELLADGVHPHPDGHAAIADAVWTGLAASGCLGKNLPG